MTLKELFTYGKYIANVGRVSMLSNKKQKKGLKQTAISSNLRIYMDLVITSNSKGKLKTEISSFLLIKKLDYIKTEFSNYYHLEDLHER